MHWCEAAERLTLARSLPDGIVEWTIERVTDGLFVDGGAHVGMFCIPVLLARPEARCVAFEPGRAMYNALLEMAELNGVRDRLKVHQVALWDHESTKVLKVPRVPTSCGFSTLGKPGRFEDWCTESVKVKTLDSYGLVPQFIKLDLEGAELYALYGATGTIMVHRPIIITEAFEPNTTQFNYEPSEIEEFLKELGYACRKGREDLFCTI